MTQRKIGKSWWVDITDDHVRYRKKSPDNSKAGAQAYEAHIRRKLAEGVSVPRSLQQRKQSQPFNEFAHFWFKTYVLVNNKPSEIVRKKSVLNKKLIPFFGKIPLNQITTLQVEQYKAQKADEGFVNQSINSQLHVLGKCLRCAQEWLELEKIPKMQILKVPPYENDFLTEEECGMLLAQMHGLWHDITFIALKTGLRIEELRGLRWQDIQWNNRTLTVNHAWCNIAKGLLSPKGNKGRSIPLTSDVHTLLSVRRQETGFVFADEHGGVFSDYRLNHEIAMACQRAGLRKISCHVLRHTYASHLALKGAPLGVVQRLLGHSNIQITMRYAHLSKSSMRNSMDLLEERYPSPQQESLDVIEEKEPSAQQEERVGREEKETSIRHEESLGLFEEQYTAARQKNQ